MGRWCVKLLNFSLNCWTRLNHCNPRYLSHHFHLDHRQECNPIGVIRPVCTNGRSPRHPRNPKGPPWRLGMAGYDWVLHIVFFFPRSSYRHIPSTFLGSEFTKQKNLRQFWESFPTQIHHHSPRSWGFEVASEDEKGELWVLREASNVFLFCNSSKWF